MPSFKRPQGSHYGQSNHGSHGSYGVKFSKGASSSKRPEGQSKEVKADFKSNVKPYSSINNVKRERGTSGNKNYDSWKKAKNILTAKEFNKLRKTNACINSCEVGRKLSDCLRP